MTKTYLKRIAAPKTWPILRKERTFIARPKPKGMPMGLTLPMVVVLRDVLRVVENANQAGKVMRTEQVKVNGKRVYHTNDAVGFMDLLTIGKDTYRILINKNNQLIVQPVKKNEDFTVQRVEGKTSLKGGKTQLNFRSGLNLLVDKDTYKVGDSVAVKEGKIAHHYALEKGATVFISGGSHIGSVGKVENVEGQMLTLTIGKEKIQTPKRYATVIGKDKPAITI